MNPYEESAARSVRLPHASVQTVRIVGGRTQQPECVLLHGNPGSLLDFAALVPELAQAANLLLVDLPGFGRSTRPSDGARGLTLARLADDVIAVCDALGIAGPLTLIGHSHGGGVAQIAAARHPERVARVVAVASLGSPAQRSYRLLGLPGALALARAGGSVFRAPKLAVLSRVILRATMRDIFHPEPLCAERVERELEFMRERAHVLESMVDVARGDPCAELLSAAESTRCPHLFVHGARDALVPPKHARAIHEARIRAGGDSRFTLLPDAGHMLMTYQASALSREIIAFLPRSVA